MRRYQPLFWVTFILLVIVIAGSGYLAGYADKQHPENIKNITVYTTLPVEQVIGLAQEYEKAVNVRVNFVPLSENELLTRMKLEKANSNADIILASSGLLDFIKQEGLIAPYSSEQTGIIPKRFKDEHSYWTGVWYDPIIFAANRDYIKSLTQVPTKWTDLTKEAPLRIGITDFLAADASANLLYTLVSAHGEEQTFEYLRKIHPKIVQYAKFLATPVRMAGMGEVDVAIAVQSESIRYVNDGFPVTIIYPEDGTAYLLTGAAVVSGTTHGAEAKQFLDWLLQDSVQATLHKNKFFFIPTNQETTAYKAYTNKNLKLLDNQHMLNGEEKKQILDKWVQKVRLSSR
jgi:iron(III) transport system substrate-binding protein